MPVALSMVWTSTCAVFGACAVVASASGGVSPLVRSQAVFAGLDVEVGPVQPEGGLGHPMFAGVGVGRAIPGVTLVGRGPTPPPTLFPTFSPLASGAYVNFESPPVKALGVSSDGRRVYLANTPAATLTVMDASGPTLRVIRHVPVGMDPVSVAVHPITGHVWVANHISDDVSIVDPVAGVVLAVVDVGDEPVNIVFSRSGRQAYVVLQGPHLQATPPFHQHSSLVTIDVATLQVTSAIELDMHSARGAALDASGSRLIVSALHSGNNTTVVGIPIVRRFPPTPTDPNPADALPSLEIVRQFSATAGVFAQASSLSPYPDVSAVPGAPMVARVVPDGGLASQWAQVVAILSDGNGGVRPEMAALYEAEFGVTNAEQVLQAVIEDAHDTADHDVALIDVSNPGMPQVASLISDVGTTLTAMAVSPLDGSLMLTEIEPTNLIRHEPNLKGKFVEHNVITIGDLGGTAQKRVFDLNAGVVVPVDPVASTAQPLQIALANPSDVVFAPNGARAYVAANGSGRIGVIDPSNGRVLARQNVGRGVRSLAVDPSGVRLYAYNRTDSTVSVLDVTQTQPQVVQTVRVFNPEPKAVKEGRHFAYSSSFGANGFSSCTSCHIDINLDHLAWDLGDPNGALLPAPSNVVDGAGNPMHNHPLKGPMVTQSLRGLDGHNAFHWRGDKPKFTDFNGAFASLLGAHQLQDGDMAAFDAFIKTVRYAPNPFWTREHAPKDPQAVQGVVLFANNCNGCHSVEHDGTLRLVGAPDDTGLNLAGLFAQIQEITQLRGIYKKFSADRFNGVGLIHDGRETRENNGHPLETFLKTFFRNLNAQDRSDMTAWVTAFPSNATNVTGWQVPISPAASAAELADVATMIVQNRSTPSRCDVIAKGVVEGASRGYVFDPSLDGTQGPGEPVFRDDAGGAKSLTALLSSIGAGEHLVFMAVPPGSGARLGIDADMDCTPDRLDAFPRSSPDFDADGAVSIGDIFAFLNAWFAGQTGADFNESSALEIQDIFDMLNHWFAGGCP